MKELTFFDSVTLRLDRSGDPLLIPWPSSVSPASILSFSTITEWRQFILGLTLHVAIPEFISERYRRAQRAYFLAWIDGDFVKLGELLALGALELALRERYAVKMRRSDRRPLPKLLEYLVEKDGLTDDKLPIVQKYGGAVVSNLYEPEAARRERVGSPQKKLVPEAPMTLVEIRNRAAHADPLDRAPWGGLLEVVRDLIEYAYRDIVAGFERSSI